MAITIKADTLLEVHRLEVGEGRVRFSKGLIRSLHTFRFDQIDCVLLSNQDELSFQVGTEVYSIPVKPSDRKHKAAMDLLIRGVRGVAASQA